MTTECIYNLTEFPTTVKTRGDQNGGVPAGTEVPIKHTFNPVPAIGTRVKVAVNGLGPGTVASYFVEHQYAGVCVRLDPATEPDWHKKQCKGTRFEGCALVFGAELKGGD